MNLFLDTHTYLWQSADLDQIPSQALDALNGDHSIFHRDPFDRLIAAQAKSLQATIIEKNIAFDRYGLERIWD